MSRPTTRRSLILENLEGRQLLTAGPTNQEQLVLELVNEALIDPSAAAERVEQSLTPAAISAIAQDGETVNTVVSDIAKVDPRPPLAWDVDLAQAAEVHTAYQIAIGGQTHTGPRGLESVVDRVHAAGYDGIGAVAENIIYGVDSTEQAMRAFLADSGATNRNDPHRVNIQQPNASEASKQDIGIAVTPVQVPVAASNPFLGSSDAGKTETKLVVTQVLARKYTPERPKILGVVYNDRDGDRFYGDGEGVGSASVTITDNATGASTRLATWGSGGYQGEVTPGRYTVEVRDGGTLIGRDNDVVVGNDNVKVDFIVGDVPKAPRPIAMAQTPAPSIPTPPPAPRPAPTPVAPAPVVRPSAVRASVVAALARPSTATPAAPSSTTAIKAAPRTLAVKSTPASTPSKEVVKAVDRPKAVVAQPSTEVAPSGALALLRSSLAGSFRLWKVGDPTDAPEAAVSRG